MSAGTWTIAEAKAKFSELVDKARVSGRRSSPRMAAPRL
jgi:hypothetical protein